MATPLKDILFNSSVTAAIADELRRVTSDFDRQGFIDSIDTALPALELKERAAFIAKTMRDHLPSDFESALNLLLRSLPEDKGRGQMSGFDDFRYMPHLTFIEKYGLDDPDRSLDALYRLTKYFTAEGAIRPYLLQHYDRTMKRLERWVSDEDWRVRRLVSEGTRPRLPWAVRLGMFIEDPGPVLTLLSHLQDDPHEVVRRSVANNINDIAKDHPDRAAALISQWAKGASGAKMAMIRHAARTLIKQGHPQTLKALGFTGEAFSVAEFSLTPKSLMLGDDLTFSARITNDDKTGHRAVIDYALQFAGKKTVTRRKVFKGTSVFIEGGASIRFNRKHSIIPITTRKYYPGEHKLEIIVNGKPLAVASFILRLD